jgi:hypothetical protein
MGVHRLRNDVGRAEGRHEADAGCVEHLQESRKLSQSAYCRAMRWHSVNWNIPNDAPVF